MANFYANSGTTEGACQTVTASTGKFESPWPFWSLELIARPVAQEPFGLEVYARVRGVRGGDSAGRGGVPGHHSTGLHHRHVVPVLDLCRDEREPHQRLAEPGAAALGERVLDGRPRRQRDGLHHRGRIQHAGRGEQRLESDGVGAAGPLARDVRDSGLPVRGGRLRRDLHRQGTSPRPPPSRSTRSSRARSSSGWSRGTSSSPPATWRWCSLAAQRDRDADVGQRHGHYGIHGGRGGVLPALSPGPWDLHRRGRRRMGLGGGHALHGRLRQRLVDQHGAPLMGTLDANFSIGPIQPLCSANSTAGPAPSSYSSLEAVVTPSPSGQASTFPIVWTSNGCEASGSLQASLAPGSYSLNLSSCTFLGCVSALPRSFLVVAGQSTSVDVSIDTGLR